MNETRPTQSLALTVACWVHSNVYGLVNIHCIRYLTTVDSSHSTSPPVKKYCTLTSCPADVPHTTTCWNSSSIGKEPVPYGWLSNGVSIRRSTTSRLVSHTEQDITPFTNLLQAHKTVVLVGCTSEPETDCTHGREVIPLSQKVWYLGIGNMLHIYRLSEESQVHRRTTRHHTSNYPHTPYDMWLSEQCVHVQNTLSVCVIAKENATSTL